MGRLRSPSPRVKTVGSRVSHEGYRSAPVKRMRGAKLQERRMRLWAGNPHCSVCGEYVVYPDGFELDHIVALTNGGKDTEDNCDIKCIACHKRKTQIDLRA